MSYDAQVTTNQRGMPSNVRLRAYRSDPDGNLLGPAKATHFGLGDVEGFDSKLTGTAAFGRGAVVTNRPLTAQTAFDRTHFEGDLPGRLGGRAVSQRGIARLCQADVRPALCL